MSTAIVAIYTAINVTDVCLYIWARNRGAGRNAIPLSGYWLAWKVYRCPE